MSDLPAAANRPRRDFLGFYDDAMPYVYGYFVRRCGHPALAQDLTAETFLAAVTAVRRETTPAMSMPWVLGVARHKLVDHWRREAREERNLRVLADTLPTAADPWDAELDAVRARQTLDLLASQHRAALTLRYLDDLPVREVASLLGRTVEATEALLVRARAAFRRVYADEDSPDA